MDAYQLAGQYIRNTNRCLFITGKAGTGKTTFLRSLQMQTSKRMAVVAPTGVAAINAEGVTIHSFFQLPPQVFLPTPSARRTLFADICCKLANQLLIGTADNYRVRSRYFNLNSLNLGNDYLMRITKVHNKVIALLLSTVTYAVNLKSL